MSVPLCIASKILNIKIFLFEPNIVLGRANRFFLNFCEKIFCYSDKMNNFPNKLTNKIIIINTLLRKEFYLAKSNENINKVINLLIIGGSQGAKLFDIVVKNSVIKLSKKYKLKIFQQTNFKNYKDLRKFYSDNSIESELFDYSDNIIELMNQTHLCVTRAGASTLAELTFLNIPYLTIPYPLAKDDHQFQNALFYKNMNCCWLLKQEDLKDDVLFNNLINIIRNKEDYLIKKKNMKRFSYQNTWNNINQKLINTIDEN
jgi:UDP-N-acetylglucosamine--N-acetylmuramyl-(pentapeptide) pyrophosphoryl-undecaprenol N-acetylglucosamine transferase